jgi:ribonuclease Z
LRTPTDPPTGDHTDLPPILSEFPNGRNILQKDGIWSDIVKNEGITVSAGPILHSVPCLGFVVVESPVPGKIDPKKYIPEIKRTRTPLSVMTRLQQGESVLLSDGLTWLHGPARRPGRKIVILGDTYDPSPIADLAANADLLVHEATNAHLPDVDPNTREDDTFESVEIRTKSRGHSTPQMAGAFATRINAHKLMLNHFSARYAGDDDEDEEAAKVMKAISSLAATTFRGEIVCARDFMSVDVELPHKRSES